MKKFAFLYNLKNHLDEMFIFFIYDALSVTFKVILSAGASDILQSFKLILEHTAVQQSHHTVIFYCNFMQINYCQKSFIFFLTQSKNSFFFQQV